MDNYNEEQFKIDFPKTEIGKRLLAETPTWMTISYSPVDYHHYISHSPIEYHHAPRTPRETLLTLHVAPFFYILKLLEKSPKVLADIGCGINFFKNFIPEIVGIDPTEHPDVDEVAFFNDAYSNAHTNSFDCAMAINSIHFISLNDISNQLRSFSNIIKPGGRGFITLNAKRMIEHTEDFVLDNQLSSHIKQQVDQALPNVLAYDDYIQTELDEAMNGNIRVVFEKEK